jgi:hypothetical protein
MGQLLHNSVTQASYECANRNMPQHFVYHRIFHSTKLCSSLPLSQSVLLFLRILIQHHVHHTRLVRLLHPLLNPIISNMQYACGCPAPKPPIPRGTVPPPSPTSAPNPNAPPAVLHPSPPPSPPPAEHHVPRLLRLMRRPTAPKPPHRETRQPLLLRQTSRRRGLYPVCRLVRRAVEAKERGGRVTIPKVLTAELRRAAPVS